LADEEKKIKETKERNYGKPHNRGSGVSQRKIRLMTMALTHDLHSGMPLVKKLIRLWN
jgi:hypothetical protein